MPTGSMIRTIEPPNIAAGTVFGVPAGSPAGTLPDYYAVTLFPATGGTFTGLITLAVAGLDFQTGAAPGSPADGQFWYDSTQKAIKGKVDGAVQALPSVLFTSKTVATAQASFTTAKSIVTGMTGIGTLTIPANALVVGKTLRVSGYGLLGCTATPTFILSVKLATVATVTTIATTLQSGITAQSFYFNTLLTCIATGPTGTIIGGGVANFGSSSTGGTPAGMVLASAADVPTTATALIDVFGGFSASSASNTVTLQGLTVEVLN